MNLTSGARLGPYEIIAPLGAGGMGEVYRARDSRLKREVAIKVLPQAFSLDADRLRRFEQEALATAALNHPNILAVFDIGTNQMGTNPGSPYVVSELLEGETVSYTHLCSPWSMTSAWCLSNWPTACTTCALSNTCSPTASARLPRRRSRSTLPSPTALSLIHI